MASFDPDKYLAKKTAKAFDPDAYLAAKDAPSAPSPEPGIMRDKTLGDYVADGRDAVLSAAGWVGDKLERYVDAPFRSGLSESIESFKDKDPYVRGHAITRGTMKALSQMGAEPTAAPRGKEILTQLGMKGDSKPASEYLPELFSETGQGWRLQRGGPLDVTGKEGAGGLLEMLGPSNLIPGEKLVAGAAKTAGKAPGKIAGLLGKAADDVERSALYKASGGTPGAIKKFKDQTIDTIKAEGLVKPLDTTADIEARVAKRLEQSTDELNTAIRSAGNRALVPTPVIERAFKTKIAALRREGSEGVKAARALESEFDNFIESIGSKKDLNLSDLIQQKRSFGGAFDRTASNATNRASKEAYFLLKKASEWAANKAGPDVASAFERNNRLLSQVIPYEKALEGQVARENALRYGGLYDTVIGAGSLGGAGTELASGDVEGALKAGGLGLLGIAGRRVVAPRAASTIASGAGLLGRGARTAEKLANATAGRAGNAAARVVEDPRVAGLLKAIVQGAEQERRSKRYQEVGQ